MLLGGGRLKVSPPIERSAAIRSDAAHELVDEGVGLDQREAELPFDDEQRREFWPASRAAARSSEGISAIRSRTVSPAGRAPK
jgi:hypothetical protein